MKAFFFAFSLDFLSIHPIDGGGGGGDGNDGGGRQEEASLLLSSSSLLSYPDLSLYRFGERTIARASKKA